MPDAVEFTGRSAPAGVHNAMEPRKMVVFSGSSVTVILPDFMLREPVPAEEDDEDDVRAARAALTESEDRMIPYEQVRRELDLE
jgi:hypothetical protein